MSQGKSLLQQFQEYLVAQKGAGKSLSEIAKDPVVQKAYEAAMGDVNKSLDKPYVSTAPQNIADMREAANLELETTAGRNRNMRENAVALEPQYENLNERRIRLERESQMSAAKAYRHMHDPLLALERDMHESRAPEFDKWLEYQKGFDNQMHTQNMMNNILRGAAVLGLTLS